MKTEMNTVKVRKTEELEAEQLGAHIGEIVRLHGSIYKIRKIRKTFFVYCKILIFFHIVNVQIHTVYWKTCFLV